MQYLKFAFCNFMGTFIHTILVFNFKNKIKKISGSVKITKIEIILEILCIYIRIEI